MLLLKPYAWLDYEAQKIYFSLMLSNGSTSYSMAASGLTIDNSDPAILMVNLAVESAAVRGLDVMHDQFNITTGYTNKRIRLQVVDGSVVKGSVTLRNKNEFFDGGEQPKCWLRMVSFPQTELHLFWNAGSSGKVLPAAPTFSFDEDRHKIVLTYQLESGSGGVQEDVRSLAAYDFSLYEFVEVQLKDGTTVRGKGTTTQTEADSSSDT